MTSDAPADVPYILIGMPSHRGTVSTSTLSALMVLQHLMLERNFKSNFINVDYAEVAHCRNVIAHEVYFNKEYTHLLFIDDDMTFEPRLIFDLYESQKDVVGAICPKRQIDLEKFFEVAASGGSFEQARADATTFVTSFLPNSKIQVKSGWVPMMGIGMGITMIKRSALELMVANGTAPDRWGSDAPPNGDLKTSPFRYGFFDSLYDEQTKAMLSEDLSFCKRWRESCGGEIWGNALYEIGHIGPMVFKGRYIDRLKQGRA